MAHGGAVPREEHDGVSDVLREILATKKTEVEAAKQRVSLDEIKARAAATSAKRPARDFFAALAREKTAIIAECKQKSPSKGVLVPNYDPVALARAYEAGGAVAISVLTDGPYFGGDLSHLVAVSAAVGIPVLRKDFVVDAYQIYEARAHGADTFLLLAGPLGTAELESFTMIGRSLGMEPLIESHSAEELALACATTGRILGINNRDLRSFRVDLDVSRALLRQAFPSPERLVVCESGIKTRSDVEMMASVGYKAFLIGESLATSSDPTAALRLLLGAS